MMDIDMKKQDFEKRIKSIRGIISQKQIPGVIINNQNDFSWLTGGRGFK